VFLLPGFALGPGWSLRICAHEVLGTGDCCELEAASSCCSTEDQTPNLVTDSEGQCDACCIDIKTSVEQSAPRPGPERLAQELEQANPCAVAVFVLAPAPDRAARAALPPSGLPPAPPGRCTPLPLRI